METKDPINTAIDIAKTAKAVLPRASYAVTAAPFMAVKSSTARMSTAAQSGAATISMKATRSARRRM